MKPCAGKLTWGQILYWGAIKFFLLCFPNYPPPTHLLISILHNAFPFFPLFWLQSEMHAPQPQSIQNKPSALLYFLVWTQSNTMEKVRGKDRLERKERKEGRTKSRTHNPNGFSMKARERERERERENSKKKPRKWTAYCHLWRYPSPFFHPSVCAFFLRIQRHFNILTKWADQRQLKRNTISQPCDPYWDEKPGSIKLPHTHTHI